MTQPRAVYDLGRRLEPTMPVSPNHPGFRMALQRRHGDLVRDDGGSAANELIVMGGHTGTHLDALAHVSQDGRLHGGIDASEAQTGGRFTRLGVETVEPIVGRGVLLDIAAHRGASLAAQPIGRDELAQVAARRGLDPVGAAAILVRTGWGRNWDDSAAYLGYATGVPGVDASGAAWIAEQGVRAAGSDTMAFEHVPSGRGHALLPVHRVLIVDHGVHIIENLALEQLAAAECYEFMFICLPLPIVGATGSPVRPVAVIL